MNRLSGFGIVATLLSGCASVPLPAPEPAVPAGVPWGLAWIPPNGEVAIRAGAVEHVLYPDASTREPGQNPAAAPTSSGAQSPQPRAAGALAQPPRVPTTSRVGEIDIREQCELERDVVPAWFFFRTASRVPERFVVAEDSCAARP